ncbi:MAG TPA: DUF3095 domain-containing protein [Polyangiaceae bacterium]
MDNFFSTLPEIERFADVTEARFYANAPEEWLVVITDVRGSTRAIEAGRYRDVNALGVASIVALRNALPDLELPYVFGGDGATLLLPGERRAECEAALRGVRKIAVTTFDLELRAGIVPVAELTRAGYPVRVGRFRVSPHVRLAMFSGSGFSRAERWVKSPDEGPRFAVSEEGPSAASLEGFECRWQPVKNRRGQIASLIVMALAEDDAERARIYRHTIHTLENALEEDAGHPISLGGLRLGAIFGDFSIEARLRSGEKQGPAYDAARKTAHNKSLIGRTLIGLKSQAGGFDGGAYPAELVANTDFRKFDEALRMVLDVSSEQLAVIREELEAERRRGDIVYGIHTAPSALITCFVKAYAGDHVHFVDGANGGYALAARELKQQLAERGR